MTTHVPAFHSLSPTERVSLRDAANHLRSTGEDETADHYADHLDVCATFGNIPTADMDAARDAGVVFDGDE